MNTTFLSVISSRTTKSSINHNISLSKVYKIEWKKGKYPSHKTKTVIQQAKILASDSIHQP